MREERTVRRSLQGRKTADRAHFIARHIAMVRSMSAATGGQARLCIGGKYRDKRSHTIQQNQKSAERAPHPVPSYIRHGGWG